MFGRVGLALRILRELSGVSQAALARKAGVGKSQLSKYETNKEKPKLDAIEKLLRALNARPLILFYVMELLEGIAQHKLLPTLLLTSDCAPLVNQNERDGYTKLLLDIIALFEAQIEGRVRRAVQGEMQSLRRNSE